MNPLKAEEQDPKLRLSGLFLIGANLIPLLGAILWDWSILEIVSVYWAENLVIGVFTVFRLFTVHPQDSGPGAWATRIGLSAFFTFHYGIFCLVHGAFVFSLLGEGRGFPGWSNVAPLFQGTMKWAMLALIVSHGVSFFWNYLGRGENRESSFDAQMMAPYPRIVVLHLAILFGAFAIQLLGQPLALLLILVIGKTVLDLKLHQRAHRRLPERETVLAEATQKWAQERTRR